MEKKQINMIPSFNNPYDYVTYLHNQWIYPEYISEKLVKIEKGKYILELSVSTGGWGDHEDIIDSLKETIFWQLHWYSHKIGGHFIFKIDFERHGFIYLPKYVKENNTYKQLIYNSPHKYDWIHISRNKKFIKPKTL